MHFLKLFDNQLTTNTVVQIWFKSGQTFPQFSKFRKCNELRSENPQKHLLWLCRGNYIEMTIAR